MHDQWKGLKKGQCTATGEGERTESKIEPEDKAEPEPAEPICFSGPILRQSVVAECVHPGVRLVASESWLCNCGLIPPPLCLSFLAYKNENNNKVGVTIWFPRKLILRTKCMAGVFSGETSDRQWGRPVWGKDEVELWTSCSRASADPQNNSGAGMALQGYLELRQVKQMFVPLNWPSTGCRLSLERCGTSCQAAPFCQGPFLGSDLAKSCQQTTPQEMKEPMPGSCSSGSVWQTTAPTTVGIKIKVINTYKSLRVGSCIF